MRKYVFHVVQFAALALSATAVLASGLEWQKGPKEGWFWYVDPPKEQEKKPDPKKEEPPPAPNQITVIPQLKTPEPAKEPPKSAMFSSAWIRDEMPKLMDRAMDDPTPENVAAYLYVQKLALMKSSAFTDQAKFVVAQSPELDENSRRPFSSVGVQAAGELARANRPKALRGVSALAGLWYFYRGDCPYCQKQGPILDGLRNTHGFKVLPVSLDGLAPPSGHFESWMTNAGQAEALSVTTTPTIVLVRPDTQEVLMIATGLSAMEELEERILISASGAGWISPELYHATRPLTDQPPSREREKEYIEHLLRALPADDKPVVNPGNASPAFEHASKGTTP